MSKQAFASSISNSQAGPAAPPPALLTCSQIQLSKPRFETKVVDKGTDENIDLSLLFEYRRDGPFAIFLGGDVELDLMNGSG